MVAADNHWKFCNEIDEKRDSFTGPTVCFGFFVLQKISELEM
jgi:hypothetical protein